MTKTGSRALETFQGDGNILDCGSDIQIVYTYIKVIRLYLKFVDFIEYKLYFSEPD